MSDYTKTTNFAAKDALITGDPAKLILGTALNTEFDAIATAISSKLNSGGTSFTSITLAGTNTLSGTLSGSGTIDGGTY